MVDYSKWKKIEISDDEDETHPNIDTPSLFRWRHQARMDRMQELKHEMEEFEKKKKEHSLKLAEAKKQWEEAEKAGASNAAELLNIYKTLEEEDMELKCAEDDLRQKEKKTPWNVDTISKAGFTKTIINSRRERPQEEQLSESEREDKMKTFISDNEADLKHYGMLKKYADSREFLKQHPQLVCEDTANYLVVWCLELEMEEKHDLMAHVAHQIICMQFILELAKAVNYDPRACLDAFFRQIQAAEPEYKASFEDELRMFKERIRKRAQEKIEAAVAEMEEAEKQARLGPGGLDPLEVIESLPDALKACFESQNVELLRETIAKMPEEEATYHMKRCVDSGLWIADAGKKDPPAEDATTPEEEEAKKQQPSSSTSTS